MKICGKCRGQKDLTDFNRDASRGDGLQTICRSCQSLKGKDYHRRVRSGQDTSVKTLDMPARCRTLVHGARGRASKKNWEFDLDQQWVTDQLSKGTCNVSGIEFVTDAPDNRHRHPFVPSIDRIDPLKGYTKDNCHLVVWMYNAMKSEATEEEVKYFINQLSRSEEE